MISEASIYGSFDFIQPPYEESSQLVFHSNTILQRFNDKILYTFQEIEGENPYFLKRPLGILLFGAPGQGKTFLANYFARLLNRPYIIVGRHNLLNRESQEVSYSFQQLVEQASKVSATVIVKNVETIVPKRDNVRNDLARLDVASILDIIRLCSEKKVFFIATTSRPQDADAQIGYSGYLNELFYLPFPDEHIRHLIFKKSLDGRPVKDIDYEALVKASENFTVANILQVVENAALESAFSKCLISTKCIMEFIQKNDEKEAKSFRDKYDNMALQLDIINGDKRKTIGFT